MKKILGFLVIGCSFSSCSGVWLHKTKSQKFDYAQHVDYDATRRGKLIVYDSLGRISKVLTESPPDVAISAMTSITSKIKKGQLEGEVAAQITESISALGKRTAAVNILRDALFRLEEMQMNNQNIDTMGASYKLFLQVLNVAQNISEVEKKAIEVKDKEIQHKIEETQFRMQQFFLKNQLVN